MSNKNQDKQKEQKQKLISRIEKSKDPSGKSIICILRKLLLVNQNKQFYDQQETEQIKKQANQFRMKFPIYLGISLFNSLILFTIVKKKARPPFSYIIPSIFLLSSIGLFTTGELKQNQAQIEEQFEKLEQRVKAQHQ